MHWLLVIAILAGYGFILLLTYFDASPKNCFYRATRRFINPPDFLRPPLPRDAPYRRCNRAKDLHRPILLNLETSDGSGQACHPDVVHIPEGFGPRKWPYWMVCTPYPYQDAYYENPEIFVSRDGVSWSIPEGLQNPIVPFPQNHCDHNSDPDMLFFRDELWLFYRTTLRSREPRKFADENKIYLTKSADGVHWSPPIEILREQAGAQLLSPAVLWDGTQFVMWTIETDSANHQLKRRTSSSGLTWSLPGVCKVEGLEQGRLPWHIDVIEDEGRLSAILVSCTGPGGIQSRMHYAHSLDRGLTWFAGGFLFEQVYEFESKLQYRASFWRVEQEPRIYELWYSACTVADVFSIAYTKVVRAQNSLLPYVGHPELETLAETRERRLTASFR